MKLQGYVGLAIILVAEVLLFSDNIIVGRWFTPIVWTGYILLADAVLLRLSGRSLIITDRLELVILILVSIVCWWIFEFYNAPRFWRSSTELWWHYHNLEPNPYLRRVGYDWAFATIFPAMFLTAEIFAKTIFKRLPTFSRLRLSHTALWVLMLIGAIAVIMPVVVISAWLAPVIWLSFILLLDPINYLRGLPSITGDVSDGNYRRLFALLAGGGWCGILWEFWNYWAISKWTYTVPFFGNIKIFEMPVLGYLGFPVFAVECWVMYIFLRSLLTRRVIQIHQDEIWLRES
ncbi:MAG: hypothetical protein M3539_03330 [Acidobacteriota bacterium]|nr:hypothetical protein [Acidobacteriota bacterium]